MANLTAAQRALTIPEIVDHILAFLLFRPLDSTNYEDGRSSKVRLNASILLHVLDCARVNLVWYSCIRNGARDVLQALFLHPQSNSSRSWNQDRTIHSNQNSYYRGLALQAPILNPVLQTAFEGYKFRYWRSGLGAEGPKHHAYLIVSRRHIQDTREKILKGSGSAIRSMLLAQPPPTTLHADIWEQHQGQQSSTSSTSGTVVTSDSGVTLDDVLSHARLVFGSVPGVISIKYTTV